MKINHNYLDKDKLMLEIPKDKRFKIFKNKKKLMKLSHSDQIKLMIINNSAHKLYLSNNVKLAMSLGLDGVYLPAFNKSYQHLCYTFKKDFQIIGSAHSIREIKIKQNQKVDHVFLSSLFKPNKNYLGLNKFRIIKNFSKNKIVALGGISEKNLKLLNLLDVCGFAGISIFKKKAP